MSTLAFTGGVAATLTWIASPFFVGFNSYLFPRVARHLTLGMVLISFAYGLRQIFDSIPLNIRLLDNFGVTLAVDQLSGYFILTSAIVTAAVILYCWDKGKTAFFYTQAIILHGSVNAVFICADFMSLYVALEVIGVAAFLLIAYPRTDRSIWVGLRYLFVSNTAMLFYLIGAVLVYQANHSFAFVGLQNAPTDAIALIFLGLLTKGGIFVSGLWLPLTHSESETPVSALLSGVVVKTGVFPLVRCALLVPDVLPILQIFSVATALLGVIYAIFEKDSKRMLAASTTSQLGFVLVAPTAAGFYALTHGLAKACLFLIAGNLPSRNFQELRRNPIDKTMWVILAIASLSVSGVPLLAGFGAKVLTLKDLNSWQAVMMNVAAVGTAIVFAKFILLPVKSPLSDSLESAKAGKKSSGFWWATSLLIGGLILANAFYLEAYSVANIIKSLVTLGVGWLAYFLIFQRFSFKLPRAPERFEHLIGGMSLMLILLLGMVLA